MAAIFHVNEDGIAWSDYTSDSDQAAIRYKALTAGARGVPPVQYLEYGPGQTDPVHQHDVGEFFMGTYMADLERRSLGLTAIPIFVKRMFRHSYIYVNTGSGIRQPADLNGKRVGLQHWFTTTAFGEPSPLATLTCAAPPAGTFSTRLPPGSTTYTSGAGAGLVVSVVPVATVGVAIAAMVVAITAPTPIARGAINRAARSG